MPSIEDRILASQTRLLSSAGNLRELKFAAALDEFKHQHELAAAERALELAKLDRETYRNGSSLRDREDLLGQIDLGQRRADFAETRLHWSERLAEKGLVSQFSLASDRESMQAAQAKLRANQEKLADFDDADHTRQLAILDRRVQIAETEVQRVRRFQTIQRAKRRVAITVRQGAKKLATVHADRLANQLRAEQTARRESIEEVDVDPPHRHPVRVGVSRSLPIRTVVPHGTVVHRGQVLVELDARPLETERQNVDEGRALAESNLQRLQEELALTRSQGELDRSQSELTVKAAKIALIEYTDGTFPKLKQTLVEKIDGMQNDVEAAERRLSWSERVMKKGYVTRMQFEKDQFALAEQRHALAQLRHDLRILEQHTYRRELAALQTAAQLARAENERTIIQTQTEGDNARANIDDLKAKTELFEAESKRLARLIAACQIVAPRGGTTLHEAPTGDSESFVVPTVGMLVQPNQILLTLVSRDDVAIRIGE